MSIADREKRVDYNVAYLVLANDYFGPRAIERVSTRRRCDGWTPLTANRLNAKAKAFTKHLSVFSSMARPLPRAIQYTLLSFRDREHCDGSNKNCNRPIADVRLPRGIRRDVPSAELKWIDPIIDQGQCLP